MDPQGCFPAPSARCSSPTSGATHPATVLKIELSPSSSESSPLSDVPILEDDDSEGAQAGPAASAAAATTISKLEPPATPSTPHSSSPLTHLPGTAPPQTPSPRPLYPSSTMDDTATPSMTLYTAVRHLCLSTGSPATQARAKAVARAAGYDAFAATVALVEADHHRAPAPPRPQTPKAHDALPPRPSVSPSTPDAPWSQHTPPPPSACPNTEAFAASAPPPSPKNDNTDDNPTLPLLIRPAPGELRPNHAKPMQRTRLWVGSVPAGTTERELRGAFGWFGNVAAAGEHGGWGEAGGVGSVVFAHRVDAEAARRAVEAGEVVVGGAVVVVGRSCGPRAGGGMDVDG